MRTFKRLFPIFLVPVLLAGVALAQPAVQSGTNQSPALKISKSQFSPVYNHAPDQPRLYFGTVVRDTADEDGVGPGPGEIPSMVEQQVPQDMSLWNSFFTWSWFSLLLAPR